MTDSKTPTDVAACTCGNLRKATRAVTRLYDAALQPAGLKATQFSLLAALSKVGDAPLTRLAEILAMDRTTLTRNLKPLVNKGLIGIGHDEDQRIRMVGLTAAGKRVFKHALPAWEQAQSRMVESLGRARWSGLLDDLGATLIAARDQ